MDSHDEKAQANALRKSIAKLLKPFVREGVRGLGLFATLDDCVPPDIQELYAAIETSKKWRYFFLKRRYRKFVATASQHNETILYLQKEFDAIPIEECFANPEGVSDLEAKRFMFLTDQAREFHIPPNSPYRHKIEKVRLFGHRRDDIIAQWRVYKPLKDMADDVQGHDGYIDKAMRLQLQTKEEDLRNQAKRFWQRYYDFPDIPELTPLIQARNETLLNTLSSDLLFLDINGVSLDEQQRRAAVSCEPSTLVIAGAGSGKTTTICGRVRFLLERQGVLPKDILLLSFSRKSAEDLQKKMAKINPKLRVGTFHKIGLDILTEQAGTKYVIEEQYDAIVEEFFAQGMKADPQAMRDILLYFALYLGHEERERKYRDEGELYAELKRGDFQTLKTRLLELSNDTEGKETIKKERVKSYEEMALANFYYINGIDYEYERPYEKKTATPDRRQYTPDFYLSKYHIYHEHYGVDARGRASQFGGEAESKYLEGMRWKREIHRLHQTVCLETRSADFHDGTVFVKLERMLRERGVEFHPLSDAEVSRALRSIYAGQSFKSFIILVKSFVSLYKSRYTDHSAFETLKQRAFDSAFSKNRAALFLSICQRVYDYYMERIRSEGKIDFDDMILSSTQLIPDLQGYRYKHIIVDEFQDISYSRMRFLKALVDHGQSQLFVVGDDWQSIYRFSGCDLNILLDFENYFGLAETYFIGHVHRNSQELQDKAKAFIEANPEQIKKKIVASKNLEDPIQVIYYDDAGPSGLLMAIEEIARIKEDAKILLLGRNNRDIDHFLSSDFDYDRARHAYVARSHPKLSFSFSTVHGSKGLEEDFVILLSAKDARNGFPNKTEDDPLLNLVMAKPSKYPYAEERRLWYVALTRTRSYVYILAPRGRESQFLKEMEGDVKVINFREMAKPTRIGNCPRCKSGHLVLRKYYGDSFYGCSNFPYCRYSIGQVEAVDEGRHCPVCGDFLIPINGRYGRYYRCHNKQCRYKEQGNGAKRR